MFFLRNGWHILRDFLHIFRVKKFSRLQHCSLQDLLQGSLPQAVASILSGEEAQQQGLSQIRNLGWAIANDQRCIWIGRLRICPISRTVEISPKNNMSWNVKTTTDSKANLRNGQIRQERFTIGWTEHWPPCLLICEIGQGPANQNLMWKWSTSENKIKPRDVDHTTGKI